MKFHIFGGGTFSHVRPHLALAAPAFGGTARRIQKILIQQHHPTPAHVDNIELHLTKMANADSRLVTNDDIKAKLFQIMADPQPCVIFMNAALCDFDVTTIDMDGGPSGMAGQSSRRLQSKNNHSLHLTAAAKVIKEIRAQRKDIFLVGFKTTTECDEPEMFRRGLNLLKGASCNLVLVNDLTTKRNMIVTPEVAPYDGPNPFDRQAILEELVDMTVARAGLSYTRTKVVDPETELHTSACLSVGGGPSDDECICGADKLGPFDLKPWREAPTALQAVVDHCVQQGGYKPFNGVTVGHFGWLERYTAGQPGRKGDALTFWSSRRKKNFNLVEDRDLVKVAVYDKEVTAYGAKPSAGARSQAQVFRDHPGFDCIVHFHCHPKDPAMRFLNPETYEGGQDDILHAPQRNLECGSHQCGNNTSMGMREFDLGDGVKVKAVHLQNHGPNILFRSSDDPQKVIDFINRNFDFDANTSKYL